MKKILLSLIILSFSLISYCQQIIPIGTPSSIVQIKDKFQIPKLRDPGADSVMVVDGSGNVKLALKAAILPFSSDSVIVRWLQKSDSCGSWGLNWKGDTIKTVSLFPCGNGGWSNPHNLVYNIGATRHYADSVGAANKTYVQAGTNVTITGNGALGNPYIINTAGGSGGTGSDADSLGGLPANHWLLKSDTASMLSPYISSYVAASIYATISSLSSKANLASPTFIGSVNIPTPTTSDNSTLAASTAYVKAQGYLTAAPVTTVAGRTGNVTLTYTDIGGSAPIFNQNTTGSAAKLTTGRTIGLTGDLSFIPMSFDGTANITTAATVQGINGVLMSGLNTGLVKNTTGTGKPVIATRGVDYLSPTDSLNPAFINIAALNNGTTATTQATTDSSKLLVNTEFFKKAPIKAVQITGRLDTSQMALTPLYSSGIITLDNTTNSPYITIGASVTKIDSIIGTVAILNTGVPKINGTDTLAKLSDLRTQIAAITPTSLQYRNYANDSLAVNVGHLNLWDYYRNGGAVQVVTTYPVVSTDLNMTFQINKGTLKQTDSVSIRLDSYSSANPFNVVVNWGDSSTTTTTYSSGFDYTMTHKYPVSGTFNATFTVSDYTKPRELYFNLINLTDTLRLFNLNHLTKLSALAKFSINTPILFQKISDTLTMPSTVSNIVMYYTNITDYNPASLPSSLTTFAMRYTPHAVFEPSVMPAGVTSINLQYNGWTATTGVNAALIFLDGHTFSGGAKTLNTVQGSSSGIPSGAGATAKTSLTGKSWTVTTD